MKKYGILLAISLLLLIVLSPSCVGTSEVTARGANQFPQVGGMNLHGDEQQFPDCLQAEQTILIVAFQRWQQEWVDEWYVQIDPLLKSNAKLAYYEVPTISKLSSPIRWWIYKGMRGGIEDPQMRSSVITLHIDKEPFKKHLNIIDEEIVYVFLVDKDGNIKARSKGRYDQDKWLSFAQEITP